MRKTLAAIVLYCSASLALASGPHFEEANAYKVQDSLLVTFAEDDVYGQVTIFSSAKVSGIDQCVRRDGSIQKSVQYVQFPVSTFRAFQAIEDDVDGSLILNPPNAPHCRRRHHLVRVLSYSNVSVLDVTHDVSKAIPGRF